MSAGVSRRCGTGMRESKIQTGRTGAARLEVPEAQRSNPSPSQPGSKPSCTPRKASEKLKLLV